MSKLPYLHEIHRDLQSDYEKANEVNQSCDSAESATCSISSTAKEKSSKAYNKRV